MQNEVIEILHEVGLTPVDWVAASRFAELTGIAEKKLNHRRKKWPQDKVWVNQDGNVYYSLKGYNEWMSQQAENRYRRACGYEAKACKSTGNAEAKNTSSPRRTRQLRRVSNQPITLEVS